MIASDTTLCDCLKNNKIYFLLAFVKQKIISSYRKVQKPQKKRY
jgi:hypothetical protein